MRIIGEILDILLTGHPLYEETKRKIAEENKEVCPSVIYPFFNVDGTNRGVAVRCTREPHEDDRCSDGSIAWRKGYQPFTPAIDADEDTVHNERSESGIREVNYRSAYPAELTEPTFTLRARDLLGPEIVREWIFRASSLGVNKEKIDDARRIANDMEDWQLTNGRKIAD